MKKKVLFILIVGFMILGLTGCGKEKKYCCKTGDTLLENGKCEAKEIMTTDVDYTCPNGYIAKTDGVCYRSDGTRAMFATKNISCPNGGSVINDKCVQYYTYNATECDKSEESEQKKDKAEKSEQKVMTNEVMTNENLAN